MQYGMFKAEAIKANQQRMERNRSGIDQYWTLIARLVYPEMDGFDQRSYRKFHALRHPGEGGTHDAYAALALDDGVSVAQGFTTPHGKRFQKLALPEPLMRSVRNQQWVEEIEYTLFDLRNDPQSGFVQATYQGFMSLYAFGAQSEWVDVRRDWRGYPIGLRYENEFIGEIYWERDSRSGHLRKHKRFNLTAEQAHDRFGEDAPKVVREAMQERRGSTEFTFLHVIEMNTGADPDRIDAKGMPIKSCYYVCGADDEVFMEGGYRTMPRVTSIYSPTATTDWGYSPTMRVLPQILRLQAIDNDRTLGAELNLLPPFLSMDDELDGAILEMVAGGVTFGGLDERGNPKYLPLGIQGDASDARELAMEARAAIDKAYGRDLLQINRELKTHITATRTAEEMAEKGVLLAPLARQEAEWLSPMTQRELALMAEHDMLPDMPDEIADYFAEHGSLHWTYDNQLSRLRKAEDSAAFLGLAEQVGALSNMAGPEGGQAVLNEFARTYSMPRVMEMLGDNAGVPAKIKMTEEEQEAFDAREAEEAQRAAQLQAVSVLAEAAKNTAAAGGGGGLGA